MMELNALCMYLSATWSMTSQSRICTYHDTYLYLVEEIGMCGIYLCHMEVRSGTYLYHGLDYVVIYLYIIWIGLCDTFLYHTDGIM